MLFPASDVPVYPLFANTVKGNNCDKIRLDRNEERTLCGDWT